MFQAMWDRRGAVTVEEWERGIDWQPRPIGGSGRNRVGTPCRPTSSSTAARRAPRGDGTPFWCDDAVSIASPYLSTVQPYARS